MIIESWNLFVLFFAIVPQLSKDWRVERQEEDKQQEETERMWKGKEQKKKIENLQPLGCREEGDEGGGGRREGEAATRSQISISSLWSLGRCERLWKTRRNRLACCSNRSQTKQIEFLAEFFLSFGSDSADRLWFPHLQTVPIWRFDYFLIASVLSAHN